MFVIQLSSLTASQSAEQLIPRDMRSIGQVLKAVLSLLFSFPSLTIHESIFFFLV